MESRIIDLYRAPLNRRGLIVAKRAPESGNIERVKGNLLRHFTRLKAQNAYFFAKWLFHKDRTETFLHEKVEDVRPVTVGVVPTVECPFSCPTCTFNEWRDLTAEQRGQRFMGLELMREIVHKLSAGGVKALIFTGGGEPLANRHTLEGMALARKLGLDAGLFTNGVLLNEDSIKHLLIDVVPNFIRLSLNAATPAGHQKFHGLQSENAFFRVIENLATLARVKYESGSQASIGVGILASPENMDDLVGLAALMERITRPYPGSINYLAFRPTVVYGGAGRVQYPQQMMSKAQSLIDGVIDPALDAIGIRAINIRERFWDLNEERGYAYCLGSPWRATVAHDGKMYTCDEQAGRPEFSIGDLATQTFDQVWFGRRREEVIRRLYDGMMHQLCPPICIMTYMNKTFEQFRLFLKDKDVAEVEKFLDLLRLAELPVDVNFL